MTEIRFYHLSTQPLETALPAILEKALERGHRVVVRAPDKKTVDFLNDKLWTYKQNSFLPHGAPGDEFAADQPVWLTDRDENPNNADVLILTGGVETDTINSYELCCEMLDGSNDAHVSAARVRWKTYQEQGFALTYWQQDERGGWEKRAG